MGKVLQENKVGTVFYGEEHCFRNYREIIINTQPKFNWSVLFSPPEIVAKASNEKKT
jgi:hypothetical protein